jgi:hypothetical protein
MPTAAMGMATEVGLTVHPPEGLQLPHDRQMAVRHDHPHQHVLQPELRDPQDHPHLIICLLQDPVRWDPEAAEVLVVAEAEVVVDLAEEEEEAVEAGEDN